MLLAEASAIAAELVELLRPVCDRIEVAGSIRRRSSSVGDIELLAIPLMQPKLDLFGETDEPVSRLDTLCADLLADGTFAARQVNGRGAWGPKYKRLGYKGAPVDLFSATADNWGLMLTIRTGPNGYSKRLVTPRAQGGWLPAGYQVKDGSLLEAGIPVPVPTEQHLYVILGREYDPPQRRTSP